MQVNAVHSINLLMLLSLFTISISSCDSLPINILPHTTTNMSVISSTEYTPRDIRILSVGDWGSAALGGYHLKNAENTANAMSVYVEKYNPKLVLNTGDNFY